MKKLIGCLLAVISASEIARAAPIVVLETAADESEKVAARFDYDAKLGRAWVDVEETDYRAEVSTNTVMKKIDGLYFGAGTKQVLYRRGNRATVCAEESSFLGIPSLHPTGKCPLRVSYEERTADDGFHPESQIIVKVTLNPAQ